MKMNWLNEMKINYLFDLFIGLSAGFTVGAGFVAFLTVLGIIPRLAQLSKSRRFIHFFENAVTAGAVFGTYLSFQTAKIPVPLPIEMLWGLLHGIFIGMLAAALTEVLNVFPILFKRIRLNRYLLTLLLAIVLGKIFGSIFQWTIFDF